MFYFNPKLNESYTPFLYQLAKNNISYKNFYSNGYYTADAISSIIASVPSFKDLNIITTNYTQNKFFTLPRLFRYFRFQTAFISTQFHDSILLFSKLSGFKKSIGFNEFTNVYEDNGWGIHDEYGFEILNQEIDKYRSKRLNYFIFYQTVSSHPPFTYPSTWKEKKFKNNTNVKNSLLYVDKQVDKFFHLEKQKGAYKDKINIITSDHTRAVSSNDIRKHMRIPLIIVHPKQQNRIIYYSGSHVDLLPTIVELYGYKEEYSSAGKSLQKIDSDNFVFMTNKSNYFSICRNRIIKFDDIKGNSEFVNLTLDKDSRYNPLKQCNENIQSYYQSSYNSMLFNRFYK